MWESTAFGAAKSYCASHCSPMLDAPIDVNVVDFEAADVVHHFSVNVNLVKTTR